MKTRNILLLAIILIASLLPWSTQAAFAKTNPDGPTDPAELEAFLDELISARMEEMHIPGVTVSVVKDGEPLFAKGYGYADVANKTAVDPETTLFRIGSISKIFTATAVMQLVEEGKLDLDTDINTYLDFEIPATYDEPITLAHLLSHTAGYEDRGHEVYAEDAESLAPLGEWLRDHQPTRVRPVGSIAAYSNYGISLAGYIVERASGMSYDAYVEQQILQPLEMNYSSPRQPLPDELVGSMAQGYSFEGGEYIPHDFEMMNTAPSGAHSANAMDMAHFMIAHLQDGQYDDERILAEETAQQMHSQLFTPDERITGMAHGFFEKEENGQYLIWHDGDTYYFHSVMELLPDENVGVFISCNSQECLGFPQIAFGEFMDHYYPVNDTPPTPTTDFDERADLIAGTYRANRMSYTTIEKLGSMFEPYSFAVEDGELVVNGVIRFIEIEPFLFRQVDGDYMAAFRQNGDGEVTHGFITQGDPGAFEPVPIADTLNLNLLVLGFSLLMFLSVVIGMPVIFLLRLRSERAEQALLAKIARGVLAALAVFCIVFVVLIVSAVMAPEEMLAMGKLPLVGLWWPVFIGIIVLTIASLGFAVLAWKDSYWGLAGRVHFTLVVLAMVPFLWFVNHWHLLTL